MGHALRKVSIKRVKSSFRKSGIPPSIQEKLLRHMGLAGAAKGAAGFRFTRADKKRLCKVLERDGMAGCYVTRNGDIRVTGRKGISFHGFNFQNKAIREKAAEARHPSFGGELAKST